MVPDPIPPPGWTGHLRPDRLRPGPAGPEPDSMAAGVLQHFAMIEAIEHGPARQRRDFQQERIAALLDHARRHSPFWAARIPAGGRALWRLPPLRKAELRAQADREGPLPVPHGQGEVGTASTSGSTSEPLRLYVTDFNGQYNESRYAFDDVAGGRDLTLPFTATSYKISAFRDYPAWPTLTGRVFATGAGRGLPLAGEGGQMTVEEFAARLLEAPLGHLLTMPWILSALADAVAAGARRPDIAGDALTFGETVWPELRERVRQTLGMRIADRYSCEEVGPIAFQCPKRDTHYHVATSNVVVECLDDRGREVPDGRPGNIVVTGLHATATPVLRYWLGDIARLLPRCPCGHAGPALADLQGRRRSLLRLPDGRRRLFHMGAATTAAWLAIAPVREVRILQTGERELVAEVAAARPLTGEECARLAAQLRSETSPDFAVRIAQVPRVDWGRGGKRMVDHRESGHHGEIRARAPHDGTAEGRDVFGIVVRVRHRPARAVELLVLEEQHRVVVADGGLHHRLRVHRGRRQRHLDARHVREPRVQRLRMLSARALAAAARQADDHRHPHLAAGQVAKHRGLMRELVDRHRHEVAELELDDRPHATDRSADGGPHHRDLRARRVADAFAAELRRQSGGHPER